MEWRAPFLPASKGEWATFPPLEDLFVYNGSGVMPGRTWVIAPDKESLQRRWTTLIQATGEQQQLLFHPHLRNGQPGDKHVHKPAPNPLHGFDTPKQPISEEKSSNVPIIRYGFRSFDRQFIVADTRVINQANPELWRVRGGRQVYLTALMAHSPRGGCALTITDLVPDLHHYKGNFGGRVFPLWADAKGSEPNVKPNLLNLLTDSLKIRVTAEDFVAYIAAVAANPTYTTRFQPDLSTPGLRIPITANKDLFTEAVELGRQVIWLHTFGERMSDPTKSRPPSPPRVEPEDREPSIPKEGAISSSPDEMPDTLDFDGSKNRLLIGHGFVQNVSAAVWNYKVSGMNVLAQWFSYRRKNRERPIMGDRRPPSPLSKIQPDHWLPEYTTELLNVLRVLTLLVELEPAQADLLERVCSGLLISFDALKTAGALASTPKLAKAKKEKIKSGSLQFGPE